MERGGSSRCAHGSGRVELFGGSLGGWRRKTAARRGASGRWEVGRKGDWGRLGEGGLLLVVDFADDFPAVGVFDEGEHVGKTGGAELGFDADDGDVVGDVAEAHFVGDVAFGGVRVVVEVIEGLDGDALHFPVFVPRHGGVGGEGFAGDAAVSLSAGFDVAVDGLGDGGFVFRGAVAGGLAVGLGGAAGGGSEGGECGHDDGVSDCFAGNHVVIGFG